LFEVSGIGGFAADDIFVQQCHQRRFEWEIIEYLTTDRDKMNSYEDAS